MRDLIGVATSRVSVKLAQFLSSLITARLLGPGGRGLVSALTVPSQLAISVSEMGVRQSTAFHLGRGIIPLQRLQPTLFAMVPIASAIAVLLSLAYFEFAHVAEGDWTLRALAVVTIPLSLSASYASGVFLGRQRIAEFRKTSWRPAAISLVLVVLLGWAAGWGVYGVMLATAGGALAASAYALYLLGKEQPLRIGFDRAVAAQLQRKGISYAASLVVLMLNYRIMILLLTRLSTLADVGLYAQAIAIAELIWEVPTMLGSLVLSRGVNAKDETLFSRKVLLLARLAFMAALGLSVCLGFAAKYLFPILYGHRFEQSADICILLLPGIVAFIVFKVLNIDLAGRGKPWTAMVVMVPVLVLNIVLGWMLIVRYGAMGAAAASSACYLIATLGYIVLYNRVTGLSMREILLPQPGDLATIRRALPFGR
ncbi:Membrane protein involved in the export of O-antigen and teichoic acid [Sphingomonas gellani]|uniref:Membrane protein involved in the export of O-antigen and teichoic acid n=1 Tax=Sphingomonas gellani TaxID=1166340 RepID=A0A1H8HWD9_9SPHN|nr:lipopolysaccharide biosynthesis protein [Sphingomonas gellani]SEN60206.1 Membrane protein involved in the export of O-antigen and teichoic acid [Sphingomonas gellani]